MKKIFLTLLLTTGMVVSAQVKIGDNETNLNSDSLLELEATDKGVLFPRVALTSTTASSPLAAHVQGMTVYNTATAGDVTPGMYTNNGAVWVKLGSNSSVSVRVATNGTLSTTDLNGYIIDGVGYTYNLGSLNTSASEGNTITFMQNSSIPLTIQGVANGSYTTPIQQGGGITFVYDADTNAWYSINTQ